MRFIRFLSLLSIVQLSFVSCSKQRIITPNNLDLKYEGRVVVSEDSASFCYPGTSVRATFTGSSISAELKTNAGYYVVEVDSHPAYKLSTYGYDCLGERKMFLLADSLGIGEHSLQLTLVSEGIFDKPQFYGFQLSNPGSIIKSRDKKHSIEFIGDSQTCGYGVEADSEKDHFADSTSNVLKSFAGLVAKRFDAEPMIVARSGIGMYRNYNGDVAGSDSALPMFYKQSFKIKSPKWDFSSFSPEIICICLGTNDISVGRYDVGLFEKAYLEFVEQIHTLYPKSKIILVGGAMLQGGKFADQKKALDYVAFSLKSKGGIDLFRFDFTPQDGKLGYGADWHPSARQHEKMADELSSFIESIDPMWKVVK